MRHRAIAVTAALIGLGVAACQGPAPPPAPVAAVTGPADGVEAAMARGDWAAAAPLLRAALARDPESLALHYRLAIAASHLDAREEALDEFRWVLRHAPAGSEEARVARAWITEAEGGPVRPPAEAAAEGAATLTGVVTSRDPVAGLRPRRRQVVLLVGLDGTPTRGRRYKRRTDDDGRYEFRNVVAGPYEVTDAIAGPTLWRQRVVLEPGHEVVLDLSTDAPVAAVPRRQGE